MRNKKPISPPSIANRLLEWHCGNAFMEDLFGDLDEMFRNDLTRMPALRAKLRYWKQCLSLMFSYAVSKRREQKSYHAYSYSNFNPAMIQNYLLVTVRSLMKSKLYVMLNILGLAIAAGCCIVAYYNFHFNADFDSNYNNASSIYRISALRKVEGKETFHSVTPIAMANLVRQNIPEAKLVTRYNFSQVSLKLSDDLFDEEIRYVDEDFFKIFEFQFLHGKAPSNGDKNKLYISDKLALKFFNTTDAVGQSVVQILNGEQLKPYEIGGVYKEQPMNSSFVDAGYALYDNYFDEVTSLRDNSWQGETVTFVQIDDSALLEVATNRIATYVETNNKAREDFKVSSFLFDPFKGMAVRDDERMTQERWTRGAISATSQNGCVIMAMLMMLIACLNLTNTTLAISSRRVKEIGVRKVMGSHRRQLIVQFLGETTLICVIAFVLGLWLTSSFLLPEFNALWPYMKLETNYFGDTGLLSSMLIILAVTIVIAGAYPAFYISKFEPVRILKGTFTFGGMTSLSLVFLMFQFIISLLGIISSIAFVQNASYQKSINLGFDSGVIYARVGDGKEAELLANELKENKDILSIAKSRHTIGWSIGKTTVKADAKEMETDILGAGDNYLRTAGITLLTGRDFELNSETDRNESVIVSEAFVEAMGWHNAIGQKIVVQDSITLYVIGTVKNIYSRGLWRKLEPLMIRYVDKDDCQYVTIATPADKLAETNAFMEEKWKKVFPNKSYSGRYLEEIVAEGIAVNENILKMFAFVGALAILLSATGLFTMVSLTISRRFKEIGIRKVLGASTTRIAGMIHAKFALVLLIASLFGAWASLIVVEAMMGGIWKFYQAPGAMTLITGISILIIIAAATVASRVYQVARMNPANSLRME